MHGEHGWYTAKVLPLIYNRALSFARKHPFGSQSNDKLDLSNADSLKCYKPKIQLKIPVIIHAPLLVVLAALISPLLKISLWCGSNWKFLSPPCMDMTISGFFNFHCLTISSSVSSGLVLSASRIYWRIIKQGTSFCEIQKTECILVVSKKTLPASSTVFFSYFKACYLYFVDINLIEKYNSSVRLLNNLSWCFKVNHWFTFLIHE